MEYNLLINLVRVPIEYLKVQRIPPSMEQIIY